MGSSKVNYEHVVFTIQTAEVLVEAMKDIREISRAILADRAKAEGKEGRIAYVF